LSAEAATPVAAAPFKKLRREAKCFWKSPFWQRVHILAFSPIYDESFWIDDPDLILPLFRTRVHRDLHYFALYRSSQLGAQTNFGRRPMRAMLI